ncbi:hypothetical protein ACVIHA_003857 [Bradyrhizobium liaoningense]
MRPPPTSVWVMKAVAAAAKTSSQPAMAPGSVSGRMTVMKMRARLAPKPSAARVRLPSSRSKLLMTGSAIRGSWIWVNARTMPSQV